ncbi:MAG TPA: hypothetical protein VMD30_11430 [Tepidisphaeraceae bacterium]|nr:hypothetical protein [Tepidisphaeraceae bacterium]
MAIGWIGEVFESDRGAGLVAEGLQGDNRPRQIFGIDGEEKIEIGCKSNVSVGNDGSASGNQVLDAVVVQGVND